MTDSVPGASGSPPGGSIFPAPLAPGPVPSGYVPLGQVLVPTPPPPPPPAAMAAPSTRGQAWRWVLWAAIGFLVGQIAGSVVALAAGAIEGKTSAQMTAIATSAVPPEWYVVSSLAGIWVGFVGAPWLASRTAGTKRFLRDLRVRFRPIDLPAGIVIGLLGQWVIDLLYAPFQHDITNYNGPTTKLTAASHGNGGIFVIVVVTALLAPLAEELFFRGLLFRGLLRLCTPGPAASPRLRKAGAVSAVVLDGILFGLAHAEWVQLAGLALFGMVLAVVTLRTGRQGMNMVAHGAFNMVAVLVALKVV